MKNEVQYSKRAVEDLERVFAEVFLASSSLEISRDYINGLMDAVEKKADFPSSGAPLLLDGVFTGYYFVVFKAYMAFYRTEHGKMLVDRVLYGKSDYLKKLFASAAEDDLTDD